VCEASADGAAPQASSMTVATGSHPLGYRRSPAITPHRALGNVDVAGTLR
jgi:hypothetical protein